MKKVAIIIPAYNAAASLPKTLESVFAQTYPDIEVWVVNDGSTDGTPEILEEFQAKGQGEGEGPRRRAEARLHVIHQENCGCYQARLNALKQIDAPYFTFADADDTVEPDWIEKMVAALERDNLDVVECNAAENSIVRLLTSPLPVLEGFALEKYKYEYLVNPKVACFVWNKLYRNQFDFSTFELTDKNTNFEDLIFNLQFFRKIRRIGFLPERLYHYETVATSAVHNFGPRQRHDFKWMVKNHFRLCRALFPNGEFGFVRLWWGHIRWRVRNTRNVIAMIVKGILR